MREFVQKYWKDVLEKWRGGPSTKLHFFSQRVLYNAGNSEAELGDNVFVLYQDETVKSKKDGNDVSTWGCVEGSGMWISCSCTG